MPSKGSAERDPTYAELGSILLIVFGAGGTLTSVSGAWSFWDTLPRLVGIVAFMFLVFVGAVLLVVPEKKRPETLEATLHALVAAFKIALKTIETIARLILAQVSKWEESRRTEEK